MRINLQPYQVDETTSRFDLACQPEIESRNLSLPHAIVIVYFEMCRLICGKRLQLETDTRMTRTHDVVTGKLDRRSHMT